MKINIGRLREEQKLEVLKAFDVSYQIVDKEKGNILSGIGSLIPGIDKNVLTVCLEVPGKGVFTVNLKASEFIVDNHNHYVLIRVPNPLLTEFSITGTEAKKLIFDKNGLFKGSNRAGDDLADQLIKSAEYELKESIVNNQEFHIKAKANAEKMLINLVRSLNPQLPNLEVEVEFYDLL